MLRFPPILAGTKSHLDHFHQPSKTGFCKFSLHLNACIVRSVDISILSSSTFRCLLLNTRKSKSLNIPKPYIFRLGQNPDDRQPAEEGRLQGRAHARGAPLHPTHAVPVRESDCGLLRLPPSLQASSLMLLHNRCSLAITL